jgi:hypothetical protein
MSPFGTNGIKNNELKGQNSMQACTSKQEVVQNNDLHVDTVSSPYWSDLTPQLTQLSFVIRWLDQFLPGSVVLSERVNRQSFCDPGDRFSLPARIYWLLDYHYATRPNVAGSIPNKVIAFLNQPNPSSRTMALESTQPLTEMSTRNLPGA